VTYNAKKNPFRGMREMELASNVCSQLSCKLGWGTFCLALLQGKMARRPSFNCQLLDKAPIWSVYDMPYKDDGKQRSHTMVMMTNLESRQQNGLGKECQQPCGLLEDSVLILRIWQTHTCYYNHT
jgi:hypothetical protein